MRISLLAVIIALVIGTASSNKISSLDYFEILEADAIQKQPVKRGVYNDIPSDYNRIDQYIFKAFKRDFRLFLTPTRGLLSQNFEASEFDDDGSAGRIFIDPDKFYSGHVFGEQASVIRAYLDDDGILTANIKTPEETYILEPAWRHIENVGLGAVLAYKESDLKRRHFEQRTCFDNAHLDKHNNRTAREASDRFSTGKCQKRFRQKRNAEYDFSLNRCPVKLVADYLFYKYIGGSSTSATVKYLISLMDRVNAIFLETTWSDFENDPESIKNVGFVIKKIEVYKNFSQQSDGYNIDRPMDVDKLLHKFSEFEGTHESQYCLVHLFTYRPFASGVLGLGYIAQSIVGSSGGICCSPVLTDTGRRLFHNTAVSSLCSSHGKTVVTREADLVTAHELGHNWGSQHDPYTGECSPNSANGGPYIMNTFSVSGYDPNNKKFSPCSLRSIKAVLQCKSDLCFIEEQRAFCGNKRVEEGEDCDEDILGSEHSQIMNTSFLPCCTSGCKFRPGAVCSPRNSPCCTENCQFAERGHLCSTRDYQICKEQSQCTGLHAECPESPPAPDRTPCLEDGECRRGECVSFCEKTDIDLKPCICENVTESCFLCCRHPQSTKCMPFTKPPLYPNLRVLSDGTRCIHGRCMRGICEKDAQDFVEHVWTIIGKWDINYFFKFLHDNVVGTVIISTLIIWIPLGCWISYLDKKKFEANKRELDDWASFLNGSGWFFVNPVVMSRVNNGRNKNSAQSVL